MRKLALAFALALATLPTLAAAQTLYPVFKADTSFNKQMPHGYFLGQVAGITEDRHGNIWVIHRPRRVVPQLDEPPKDASGVPAPSVVEYDARGNFIRAWGGPFAMSKSDLARFDWPESEHGIAVDTRDNVWICGNGGDPKSGKDDNQCLKFTMDGQFILSIGKSAASKGSLDTANLNHPAQPVYWAPANEIFIADGYVNRRIIVFDADSGRFKRMWGAYGKQPDDSVSRKRAYDPVPPQFNLVHGLTISKDGTVYVADRNNNRVQAFTVDGKFIRENFVAKEIPMKGFGTVNSVALSADRDQRFLYVCEGHNQAIRVLDRQTLQEIPAGTFGHVGAYPGQFMGLHIIATDHHGNLYTGDGRDGRVQKFTYVGMKR